VIRVCRRLQVDRRWPWKSSGTGNQVRLMRLPARARSQRRQERRSQRRAKISRRQPSGYPVRLRIGNDDRARGKGQSLRHHGRKADLRLADTVIGVVVGVAAAWLVRAVRRTAS
jgi:hypothetical protein